MKDSSKKVLLWLYEPITQTKNKLMVRWVPTTVVAQLVPELTPGGRRALVNYLKRENLIETESRENQTYLRLTQQGQSSLEDLFPALNPRRLAWEGKWLIIVFLDSPSNDPQFRYLRTVLQSERAGMLSRGVYLLPSPLSTGLLQLARTLYSENITIMELDRWHFGDERIVVGRLFMLSDISQSLSGISKEVDELLRLGGRQSNFIYQHNSRIYLAFHRLYQILQSEIGITQYYYPTTTSSADLLRQLQRLENT